MSILTCFSKFIEKILFVQLSSFIKKQIVINQHGFQNNISTPHAMLDVVTLSYNNIHNQSYSELAFFDLKKAFDTESQNVFLTKLSKYIIFKA